MKYLIELDPGRCVGCGACAVACMDQNDIVPARPQDLFRKIATIEIGHGPSTRFVYLSVACMHCDDAPCITACPSGCLRKDPDTGFTVYDNANCIGCRSCSLACPFAAPTFNADGKMQKCDGCVVRVQHGLAPACVSVCPFDALTCLEEGEASKRAAAKSQYRFAESMVGKERALSASFRRD